MKTNLKIIGISNDHDVVNNYFQKDKQNIESVEFKAYDND